MEKLKISQKVKDFPSSFTRPEDLASTASNSTWQQPTLSWPCPFPSLLNLLLEHVVQLPLRYRDADREGQSCRRPPCLLDRMEVNTSGRRGNGGLNQVVCNEGRSSQWAAEPSEPTGEEMAASGQQRKKGELKITLTFPDWITRKPPRCN